MSSLRYFAKYTGKGRYSVNCQVSGNNKTGLHDGFTRSQHRVFPQIPDPHSPLCCGSDAMPPGSKKTATGNFTRFVVINIATIILNLNNYGSVYTT